MSFQTQNIYGLMTMKFTQNPRYPEQIKESRGNQGHLSQKTLLSTT